MYATLCLHLIAIHAANGMEIKHLCTADVPSKAEVSGNFLVGQYLYQLLADTQRGSYNPRSQFELGLAYATASMTLAQDHGAAFKLFSTSAAFNYPPAMFALSSYLRGGTGGVTVNRSLADDLVAKAIDLGGTSWQGLSTFMPGARLNCGTSNASILDAFSAHFLQKKWEQDRHFDHINALICAGLPQPSSTDTVQNKMIPDKWSFKAQEFVERRMPARDLPAVHSPNYARGSSNSVPGRVQASRGEPGASVPAGMFGEWLLTDILGPVKEYFKRFVSSELFRNLFANNAFGVNTIKIRISKPDAAGAPNTFALAKVRPDMTMEIQPRPDKYTDPDMHVQILPSNVITFHVCWPGEEAANVKAWDQIPPFRFMPSPPATCCAVWDGQMLVVVSKGILKPPDAHSEMADAHEVEVAESFWLDPVDSDRLFIEEMSQGATIRKVYTRVGV
jgi:hypothetical protein